MPTPAVKNFNTKRPTQLTYGLNPHHKPQSETLVQPSQTLVQSSEKPKQINKNVLKCLNQVIQELIVCLEKKDMPLPVGTIMIKLITGDK